MVKFNIIGTGFLDVSDPSGVAFKADNPFYRFCDVSLGRSTEFSVPATDRNRQMLGFAEDPAEYGEMLRRRYKAQMVYDGGVVDGTIAVTAYEGNAFKCVFTLGNAGWIDDFQKKKLKDIPMLQPASITWQSSEIAASDNNKLLQMVLYDMPASGGVPPLPVPCVNVKRFISNLLGPLGIGTGYAAGIENYWLVAGSMVGGGEESVAIASTAADNMTVTGDTYSYFTVEDIGIEWGTIELWSHGVIGGGSFSAKGLKATRALKLTFPTAGVPNCYVVQWSRGMTRYKQLAGPDLNGMTVDIPKDGIIFFAASPVRWYGYRDTFHPLSVSVKVESQDSNMDKDDEWRLECNLPDMTLFEFLKAVALGTGNDLMVIPTDVAVTQSEYGIPWAKALDKVISVDKVARWVEAWGSGTKTARVVFDSEDYVRNHIVSEYAVDNDDADSVKEAKCAFSEGDIGDHGIYIADRDETKFTAKKWTLAYAEKGDTYLQRVGVPSLVAYDDIAANSTCMTVKVSAPLADFVQLASLYGFMRLYFWHGSSWVWTSASWSDRVMTLTLQKVSQSAVEVTPPPPAVVSIKAQFNQGSAVVVGTDNIDTLKQYLTVYATYSDSTTRVLDASEYTLTGTLAYPSATITVDCQGVTDKFTVAVAYDAQVEYLRSSGSQWIDTAIILQENDSVEIEAMFLNKSGDNFMMGANGLSGEGGVWILVYGNKTHYVRFGSTSSVSQYGDASGNMGVWRTYTIRKGSFYVDGVIKLDPSYVSMPTRSLGIFGRNSSTPSGGVCEIRTAKITSDNTLVLNLIPVRCGTTGYMYDRVSGTLFGNDGTGDFIVGADV